MRILCINLLYGHFFPFDKHSFGSVVHRITEFSADKGLKVEIELLWYEVLLKLFENYEGV